MSRHAGRSLAWTGTARRLSKIRRVILVGSGKGGVGKSLVACGLAIALARSGARTGILDLDVHGASAPEYLKVRPPLKSGAEGIEPGRYAGLEVMSTGLFTGSRPVPLRGDEKESLIPQMFALTNWGSLDYLVVDLPPSIGEELLSALRLFGGNCSLILVTTPSRLALEVVSRLGAFARGEGVAVEGVVVNMAYIQGGPRKRAYPFGRLDRELFERSLKAEVLVEIPLDPRIESGGIRVVGDRTSQISEAFDSLARGLTRMTRRGAGSGVAS